MKLWTSHPHIEGVPSLTWLRGDSVGTSKPGRDDEIDAGRAQASLKAAPADRPLVVEFENGDKTERHMKARKAIAAIADLEYGDRGGKHFGIFAQTGGNAPWGYHQDHENYASREEEIKRWRAGTLLVRQFYLTGTRLRTLELRGGFSYLDQLMDGAAAMWGRLSDHSLAVVAATVLTSFKGVDDAGVESAAIPPMIMEHLIRGFLDRGVDVCVWHPSNLLIPSATAAAVGRISEAIPKERG